ncbi:MAG: hypothetical protein CUN53_00160 [Phototrophicales bacterium]|nr:MAG: hypothetical protein CUN53_00160 [Phototrophicales bacterium]
MTMVTLLERAEESTDTEQVSKARLKARMLEIFRRIEREGTELIVTDHGRPTLRIIPIRKKIPVEVVFAKERRAIAEGKVQFIPDDVLLAPLDAEDYSIDTDWNFAAVPKKKRTKRNQQRK